MNKEETQTKEIFSVLFSSSVQAAELESLIMRALTKGIEIA